ncbi:hypothetical protein E2C01_044578 [Portunus trituberculatus]|uniref:Uncharacterized protein n=1 Tax=Portunus trituberculatus TaxID=210409 RepID=A0A5B7G0T6_PORTR|nr:hypothetical protein [Portunus trituberculatus]
MKSQSLRNIKKFSFPHRMVDIWNGSSGEIVTAESVHKFKENKRGNFRVFQVLVNVTNVHGEKEVDQLSIVGSNILGFHGYLQSSSLQSHTAINGANN